MFAVEDEMCSWDNPMMLKIATDVFPVDRAGSGELPARFENFSRCPLKFDNFQDIIGSTLHHRWAFLHLRRDGKPILQILKRFCLILPLARTILLASISENCSGQNMHSRSQRKRHERSE
jgi:hypothetical protein